MALTGRGFGLLCVGAYGLGWIAAAMPNAVAREFPTLPVQAQDHAFKLTPGRPCNQMLFMPAQCREMQPKRWTIREIAQMHELLAPLFVPVTGLPGFIARVVNQGYTQILRYRSGSGSAWTSFKDHSINIADSLILPVYPPDTTSGFDLQKQILLHELAHAFEANQLSTSPEFLRLAGWRVVNGAPQIPGIAPSEIDHAVGEFVRYIHAGDLPSAYRANRDFGLAHGYPTAYAMTSPSECFAELVSHLYYDPQAERYMSAELVQWLRANVLN